MTPVSITMSGHDATTPGGGGPQGKHAKEKADRKKEMGYNFMWREKVHVGTPGVGLVPGTMTRTTPQPRPWAWTFTTLYSAAKPRSFMDQAKNAAASAAGVGGHGGHGGHHDGGSSLGSLAGDDYEEDEAGGGGFAALGGVHRAARGRGVGLRLNLVETILFANGRPTKWLGTSVRAFTCPCVS